ncbi:MAG: nucleotidyltransferase domain-containing protein [Coriobacteriia bacterium]|nr:nucleotidyltransferase domain-containing protein [Coriobacteriia bacterium]
MAARCARGTRRSSCSSRSCWSISRPMSCRGEILTIAERRRVHNIRVIGSVARGDARRDSDIDLLVDLLPSASLYDLAGFAGEVEVLLGAAVTAIRDQRLRLRDLLDAADKILERTTEGREGFYAGSCTATSIWTLR